MEDNIETLKRQIMECSASGKISDSDMDMLKIKAQKLGLSPVVLNAMISEQTGIEMASGGFRPQWYHLVLALLIVAVLSVIVFLTIDFSSDGGNVARDANTSLRNTPISAGDLVHIYSGHCDGKSILITVKSVEEQKGGKCVMVYDIKCDFVPVATAARCDVDLEARTFDFGYNSALSRKVDLSTGTIGRTMAGKVVLKPSNGKFELIQL